MKRALFRIARAISLGGAVALATLGAGCGEDVDYYSMVKDVCAYTRPDAMTYATGSSTRTTLTADCKAALESIIPYDQASWAVAPTGLKDHVTEAFQVVVGYPLALPKENTILGTRPEHAGAIPLSFWNLFKAEENLNQAVFNYMLNQLDTITYGGSRGSALAQMMPDPRHGARTMTIFDIFWQEGTLGVPVDQASILVHEIRHADGIVHQTCPSDRGGGFAGAAACDPELNGAYGFGVIYELALIQGSGEAQLATGRASLSHDGIMQLANDACIRLKYNVNHKYPSLDALLDSVDCWSLQYSWVAERLNLPR